MNYLYWFLACVILLSNACQSPTLLDKYFHGVEQITDMNTLKTFKNIPKDSILIFKKRIFIENRTLLYALDSLSGVHAETSLYMEQNKVPYKFEEEYFLLAFHYYLNGKKVDKDAILHDIMTYCLRHDSNSNEYTRSTPISNMNDANLQLNDTLNIWLPVIFKHHVASVDYQPGFDFNFKDSLQIKAILLEKRYTLENGKTDSSDLIFKLKILALSNPDYRITWKKRNIGDDFDLHLKNYKRRIK